MSEDVLAVGVGMDLGQALALAPLLGGLVVAHQVVDLALRQRRVAVGPVGLLLGIGGDRVLHQGEVVGPELDVLGFNLAETERLSQVKVSVDLGGHVGSEVNILGGHASRGEGGEYCCAAEERLLHCLLVWVV